MRLTAYQTFLMIMNKFKVQLHCHTKSDPEDWIFHTEKDLIDRAHSLNYDVLSITCHNRVVFSDELNKYAKEKGILLIPGIEKSVNKKHVVIINAHKDSEKINTFAELSDYKKNHPESLIFAPHPYHPLPIKLVSLNKFLDKYSHLFDAFELSSFYTKYFDFNKTVKEKAKQLNKPLIATSDNHVLALLNDSYTHVDAEEKTTEDIIKAVKKGQMKLTTKPISMIRLSLMTVRLTFLELTKRLLKKFKIIRV